GALKAGAQYAVEFATWAVTSWSTSTINDGVYDSTHVYISTGIGVADNPGSSESYSLTGLTDGTTYFVRLWTKDVAGNWSAISNGAKTQSGVDCSTFTSVVTSSWSLYTTWDSGI